MLFSSLVFLWYFLPAVFLLYFITKNLHIRNGVLLAASLFFYAWGEPKYVILMLVSIGLNYFFGLWIGRMQSKHRMRLAVTTCVFLNLLLLGYFKYFNFAVEIANSLLSRFAGGAHTLSFREIALPVGISFYTFQALSYVVDVYRGTIQAQKNIFHLALYISFRSSSRDRSSSITMSANRLETGSVRRRGWRMESSAFPTDWRKKCCLLIPLRRRWTG
jgi:alginate O-acetyltransferase complex protein AlgI